MVETFTVSTPAMREHLRDIDPETRALWMAAVCWCSQHAMAGKLPANRLLAARQMASDDLCGPLSQLQDQAAELVRAGIWVEVEGGWDINPLDIVIQWGRPIPIREDA